MNNDQWRALENYIEAMIDEKIEDAFGRDGLDESIRAGELRGEARKAFGLQED